MTLLISKPYESDSKESSTVSPPPDLFDFSFPIPPSSINTYAADEVFHHGRLLPISTPHPNKLETEKPAIKPLNHRRTASLGARIHRTCGGESLKSDYQRLRRASSDPRPSPASGAWQKWPFFVLGSVRLPAEMEMKDIRSRQRRRGPVVAAELLADNGGQKNRWRILRLLSCKASENTAVSPAPATARFIP